MPSCGDKYLGQHSCRKWLMTYLKFEKLPFKNAFRICKMSPVLIRPHFIKNASIEDAYLCCWHSWCSWQRLVVQLELVWYTVDYRKSGRCQWHSKKRRVSNRWLYASIPERKIWALIALMQNNLSDLSIVSNMQLLNFQWHFMISWHGNAFRITDPLWWESTGGRWFPIRTVQKQHVPYSQSSITVVCRYNTI